MKSWKKPTPDLVDRAVALLAHAEHERYFFDRLENPKWLQPLRERGFFRRPTDPVRDEEQGTIHFPPWPEAGYLARMAGSNPELVGQIIDQMQDTENAAAQSDLLDALVAIPAQQISAAISEKVAGWSQSPHLLLPEKLMTFSVHLADAGRTGEALRIAGTLLETLPGAQGSHAGETGQDSGLPAEPVTRFESWEYKDVLERQFPELVRAAGLPALRLASDLLDRCVSLYPYTPKDRVGEDYSFVWRPAVQDDPQNPEDLPRGALVSAARDAAETVVESGQATVEEVVSLLESRRWKIFRRIALHVLRRFPDQSIVLIGERLSDHALFEDKTLQHEYVLLLGENFGKLGQEDQNEILGWIEAGPDVESFRERRRSASQTPVGEQEVVQYREGWQLGWLKRIGVENLPQNWKERYGDLVERYGEPQPAEFPVYKAQAAWVGPVGPKSAEELAAMPVDEILGLLQTWVPPQSIFDEPSREGLGRALTSTVTEDPSRFAMGAPRFQGLSPEYVGALLRGLGDAVTKGKTFDWGPVLDLSAWVVTQPAAGRGAGAVDEEAVQAWSWGRQMAGRLLSEGFTEEPQGVPFEFREQAWRVLQPLTDDPEPTPGYEDQYGGSNMDPPTLSINTVRGQAMHAVMRYALWAKGHLERQIEGQEKTWPGFAAMPEVQEVLEAHLDRARDPSLAVRSVYGQWFPWLALVDTGWARQKASDIFPLGEEDRAYFEAAWNTYVVFCQPYDDVLEVLREAYGEAIQSIGSGKGETHLSGDPDEGLAQHLMAFCWRGKLSLDDPLLVLFWEKASDDLRAFALGFIGRSLQNTEGPIDARILDRLSKLWEGRLSAAEEDPQNHAGEMMAFGWWFAFGKFDIKWALVQLREALSVTTQAPPMRRRGQPDASVMDKLAEIAGQFPHEAVQCLRLMVEGDREGWRIYAWRGKARTILAAGMRNVEARSEAEATINYLGSRGFVDDFRDLLDEAPT
jgi:hypothetical protein